MTQHIILVGLFPEKRYAYKGTPIRVRRLDFITILSSPLF